MSIGSTYSRTLVGSGLSFGLQSTITSPLATPWSVDLAAAKTGTLTTRTSNTAGTLTMDPGHGFTTGQRLDIYWTGGSAFGATIGTVSTNSVPFTLAEGDSLPIATTAITAQVPTSEPVAFTGANAVALAISMTQGGRVVFSLSNNTTVYAVANQSTLGTWSWVSADGGTNPVTGSAVAKVYLSQGSTTAGTATGMVMFS